MTPYSNNVVDQNGIALAGITVTVRKEDGTLAALFDDDGLPLTQPLETDTFGVFEFQADVAFYDVEYRRFGILVREDRIVVGTPVNVPIELPLLSGLVRTSRSTLTAAQYRTLTAKLDDRFDLRDMGNAIDMSGNNASTSGFQAAIAEAVSSKACLHIPAGGKIVLDAPILITDGVALQGELNSIGRAVAGYTSGAAIGPASRIHFAHTGIGFQCGDPNAPAVFDGVSFRDIMTTRDQPVPVTGQAYTPANHNFDFVMFGMAGLHLQDMLCLNPTRMVKMAGGGGIGRLFMDNVMAQPLIEGVRVELAADVVRGSNLHFWPIWRDHKEVARWTLNNADHIYLQRCDTPMFTNIFSIGARSMIRLGNNANGGTSKLKVTNYDCDYSKLGIWFDPTSQNAWGRFTNGTLQGAAANDLSNVPGLPVRSNFTMEGINCFAMFNGVEMSGSSGSAVKLLGSSNRMEVSDDFWLQSYGEDGRGTGTPNTEPGISVGAANTFISNNRILNTSPGAGPLVGGPGTIRGLRVGYTPTVTTFNGVVPAFTVDTAQYIVEGNTVRVDVTLVITNGNGSTGWMRIGAPLVADKTFVGAAQDITIDQQLSCTGVIETTTSVQVSRSDGAPVAITDRAISASFSYTLP